MALLFCGSVSASGSVGLSSSMHGCVLQKGVKGRLQERSAAASPAAIAWAQPTMIAHTLNASMSGVQWHRKPPSMGPAHAYSACIQRLHERTAAAARAAIAWAPPTLIAHALDAHMSGARRHCTEAATAWAEPMLTAAVVPAAAAAITSTATATTTALATPAKVMAATAATAATAAKRRQLRLVHKRAVACARDDSRAGSMS